MAPDHLHPGVYVQEGDGGGRTIAGVDTSITGFVGGAARGPTGRPVHVRSVADFTGLFGAVSAEAPLSSAISHFFQQGGTDALVVRVVPGGLAGSASDGGGASRSITDADVVGDAGAATGIHALDQAGLVSLVCIPPLGPDRDVSLATWAEAAAYCLARRAMLLVDPPASWKATSTAEAGVEAMRAALGAAARNAALYFPRLRMADPAGGGGLADLAPCGAIAGVIARIDRQRGVWKPPAGTSAVLSGVEGFSLELGDDEHRRLNALGVNGLRSVHPEGRIVWGARTLEGADSLGSEWKYLSVRRLALFLEESILRGTRWAVFEPAGEALWSQLRLYVGAFLHGLFREGAFQGTTPQEAYFVRCDGSTTTQADIEEGFVNIRVGFAPLRPAEFVVLHIRQGTGGQS